ncbi:integrating conjugative element protein [Vibrio mediterranei]|uniref:integrating conjugative element protein n=1 Tax=Vibrio mediterranei TaxID=689 RepID=UPI0038CF1435
MAVKPIILSMLFTLLVMSATVWASDPFEQMLPVITPSLTPGEVTSRTLTQSVPLPLFIVGDDPLSHRWLLAKQDYLRKIGAKGMVVNVRTLAGWRRMQQYNLTLYPVQGDDFARAFGLSHYPVFIEKHVIKQ